MTNSTVAFSWEMSLSGEDLSRSSRLCHREQTCLLGRTFPNIRPSKSRQGRLIRSQGVTDSHSTDLKKRTSRQFTLEKWLLYALMSFDLVFEKWELKCCSFQYSGHYCPFKNHTTDVFRPTDRGHKQWHKVCTLTSLETPLSLYWATRSGNLMTISEWMMDTSFPTAGSKSKATHSSQL